MTSKNKEAAQESVDAPDKASKEPAESKATAGKGRPTPKRKDAQAQNLHPLVPADRKASRKAAKARMRERENAEYEAMRTGDINNMPKSERLPWRVYIRDYVDARFNIGEFFIPVAFGIIAVSIIFSATIQNAYASIIPLIVMYAYLIAIIADIALMWHTLKKKLIAKYGEACVAKGTRSATYAWSRAIQIRRWRIPKPRYPKRGHWPE